jgi:hypothetical protein
VLDVSSCPLSELDAERVPSALSGDVIAGVLQRFDGRLSGTALFALDPGDALLWLQSAAKGEGDSDGADGADGEEEGDPLARFVDFGSRIIAGLVESLAAVGADEIRLGPPRLEERSWMAALLATHAPSDTLVITLTGELGFEIAGVSAALVAPFAVQILLEPKLVAGIVHGLAAEHEEERG